MRIISGTKKGMRLLPPKGHTTRPIIDRVKESVFDVLYKYDLIEDRFVADLFCGTGSFGLEALSRGAKEAVFVDMGKPVINILKKNITKTGFVSQSRVVCANAFKIGTATNSDEYKSSLVFVDPPYEMSKDTGVESHLGRLLELLCQQVADDGLVIVRTEKRVNLLDSYAGLRIIDRRTWSSMAVTFLALKKDDE
ncbi:MAG: 16S rRNA (guanine(966)-N(2))-methyltransferase RsmD [Sedimentisphaerales bacterium]|nr:16S rRNA (guanine(966)-N(2))-methyltransferase RsmD [Sedimentisphaerales bacterium]